MSHSMWEHARLISQQLKIRFAIAIEKYALEIEGPPPSLGLDWVFRELCFC